MIEYSTKHDTRKKAPGLCAARYVYNCYKWRMQHHNLGFNITFEEFLEMTQKDCFYCGKEPEQISRKQNANGVYIYNGLDRVDNNKGYIKGNCVPCCQICNEKKKALSPKEFAKWVQNVYEHWAKDIDTRMSFGSILTIDELCQVFKLSKRTIQRMINSDELPYIELNGAIRFDEKQITTWLAKRSRAGRIRRKVDVV